MVNYERLLTGRGFLFSSRIKNKVKTYVILLNRIKDFILTSFR